MNRDFLYEYELIMYDMAKYINEITWGGHEKGCDLFAVDPRGRDSRCTCIDGALKRMRSAINDRYRVDSHAIAADEGDPKVELELVRQELHQVHRMLVGGKGETPTEAAARVMDAYLLLCRRERDLECRTTAGV